MARLERDKEARDEVQMGIEEGTADDVTNAELLDQVGSSEPRTTRPMDRFTMPMNPSSLANTKMIRQQKISEKLCKQRLHVLKRFIARWLYVRGNILFHSQFSCL